MYSRTSHLFKDSLMNNIRAAKPEADKEEVMGAVKAARCEDIIKKMPQGLDTVVGTKGGVPVGAVKCRELHWPEQS